MECLDEDRLWAHLRHEGPDDDEAAVEAHLDTCDACRQLVASAIRAQLVDASSTEVGHGEPLPIRFLPRGTAIGRFVILHRLGAGAMGVVYAAYDPQLDRRVALKFLFAETGRLLDEARALARVSHPNVTAVHDVGVYGGHPFLALEFVPGVTLNVWRRTTEPTLEQSLELLRQAGRGLAAAHRAGITHRDFKPSNVMVADGRAWVTDFGLGGPTAEVPVATLMGTPAYMAPEQLAGQLGDARSDQFSFCVTAWELLFGRRPFDAATREQLQERLQQPPLVPPGRKVPAAVVEALRKGLEREPARRHVDLEHLLAQLVPKPTRWVVLIAAVVLLGGAAALGLNQTQRDPCNDADAEVRALWNDAARNRINDAFARSPMASRPLVLEALLVQLGSHHQSLSSSYTDACRRFTEHHDDESVYQRRRACLHRRAGAMAHVIETLDSPRGWTVDTETAVGMALPSVEACATLQAINLPPLPADPARREQVLQLEQRLSGLEAAWALQQYQEHLDDMVALTSEIRAAGFDPLLAEVLRMLGRWQFTLGQDEQARSSLKEAGQVALRSGYDSLAVHSWNTLASVDATRLGRLDEADDYQSLALALSMRDGVEPWARVQALYRTAIVRHAQQRDTEAAALLDEALERGSAVSRDTAALAGAVTLLAEVERTQGRLTQAEMRLRRLLAQLEKAPQLGPSRGTDARYELGLTLKALGRLEEARVVLEEAHTAYLGMYGPQHVRTAETSLALAELAALAKAPEPQRHWAEAALLGLDGGHGTEPLIQRARQLAAP